MKHKVNDRKRVEKQDSSIIGIVFSLLFFLFWRIDSWLCSLPAWLTLILHFTAGLSIKWFWATLIVWIIVGVLRFIMIMFARWGSSEPEPEKENKNPYSVGKGK